MLPKFISSVRNKEEVEGTRYIRSSASPLYSVYLACHSDSSFVRPTGQLLTINDSARSRRCARFGSCSVLTEAEHTYCGIPCE